MSLCFHSVPIDSLYFGTFYEIKVCISDWFFWNLSQVDKYAIILSVHLLNTCSATAFFQFSGSFTVFQQLLKIISYGSDNSEL